MRGAMGTTAGYSDPRVRADVNVRQPMAAEIRETFQMMEKEAALVRANSATVADSLLGPQPEDANVVGVHAEDGGGYAALLHDLLASARRVRESLSRATTSLERVTRELG